MDKLAVSWKQAFTKHKFSLHRDKPEDFHTSQWDFLSPLAYCVLRVLLATWLITWLIVELAIVASAKYFLYMTHWSYLFVTAYFISASVSSIRALLPKSETTDETTETNNSSIPYHSRVNWLLFNIASATSLLITLGYWGLLYRNTASQRDGLWDTFKRIHKHGGTFLIMMAETLISRLPHRIAHFFHTFVFTACYMILHLIYWLSTNQSPYGLVFDYRKNPVSATITTIGVLVTTPLGHVIVHLFYKLRRYISNRTQPTNDLAPASVLVINDKAVELDNNGDSPNEQV